LKFNVAEQHFFTAEVIPSSCGTGGGWGKYDLMSFGGKILTGRREKDESLKL
jgi:hypothetical protein